MTKYLVSFVLIASITGCTMRASEECESAWQSSPDEGTTCETSVARAQDLDDATDTTSGTTTGQTDEIISPRDPASGLPTGKRMHRAYSTTPISP